ncbi:MAG: IS256 family transposase [Dehalococcoidia bacterium]|nr:IS256 family transposase [Dehalococcoidia bacterium]
MAIFNGPAIKTEIIDELLKSVSKPEDLLGQEGLLRQLTSRLMERVLQAEMTHHLGFEANQPKPAGADNGRNGYTSKTVLTDQGELTIDVPRDRQGTFEPQLVRKRERRVSGFDDRILALYARGMSVRDIQGHLQEMYGVEVSPDLISRVTEAVREDVTAWQSRPLEPVYCIVYLDALVVKVRDQGVVRNKSVYIALGVTTQGTKEVLGLWIEQNEGAKFWLKVINELKTRGVNDVLIACCDGLKGFPEAIEAVFPKTVVQTCIVHMIRNSARFVSYKDRKELVRDLKPIYAAPNREGAENALTAFEEKWGRRYPMIGASWRSNWERVVPFLDFPPDIRRIIYTTNAIESLNSSLRKLVHHRGHFPSDEAVTKLLYLALRNIEQRWNRCAREWSKALGQFAVFFEGRLPST